MAKAKAKKASAAAPARKGGKKAAAKGARGAKAKAKPAKQEATGIKGRFSRAQASRSKPAKGGKAQQKAKGGSRTVQFLREVKVELSKVTWPSRDELVQSTIAVMIAVLITGVFIFLLDVAFSRLIGLAS